MSLEFGRHLDIIKQELNFWESFGNEILREELASLREKIQPQREAGESGKVAKGRLNVQLEDIRGPVGMQRVIPILHTDNPAFKLKLVFSENQEQLFITNQETDMGFVISASEDRLPTAFLSEYPMDIGRSLEGLTPYQKFSTAGRLVKWISNHFELEHSKKQTTQQSVST